MGHHAHAGVQDCSPVVYSARCEQVMERQQGEASGKHVSVKPTAAGEHGKKITCAPHRSGARNAMTMDDRASGLPLRAKSSTSCPSTANASCRAVRQVQRRRHTRLRLARVDGLE